MQNRPRYNRCLRAFLLFLFVFTLVNGFPAETAAGSASLSPPHLVRDINTCTESSDPSFVTKTDQVVYFLAHQVSVGTSLWSSDGTEDGTTLVKTLFSGTQSYHLATEGTWMDGRFYFIAHGGSSPGVISLWTSDGTHAGTYALYQFENDMQSPDLQILLPGIMRYISFSMNLQHREEGSSFGAPMVAYQVLCGFFKSMHRIHRLIHAV